MGYLFTLLLRNIEKVKNLSLYLLASIISGIVGIMFNPFLAANLSAVDYSIIGYYASFNFLFTPILSFSLISYYARKYYTIEEEKRQAAYDVIVSSLLVWGAVSFVVISGCFYWYFRAVGVELPFFPFFFLYIFQLIFNNFLLIYQVNCRVRSDAAGFLKITLISIFLSLVLSIIFVVIFKYGAVGRMMALLISSLIIAFIILKKTFLKFSIDRKVLNEAISFGWPVSCSGIVQFFLTGIDITILESLNDLPNMGLYVVAASTINYLSLLYTALAQTFEPDLYKAVAQFEYKKLTKIVLLIIVIIIPVITLFFLFAKPIMSLLTYDRYTDAYRLAKILSFSVLSSYLMIALETIINAFGYTKLVLLNKIAASAIAIFFYYFMIEHFGFLGAAWGRVFAPFVVFFLSVLSLVLFKQKINMTGYGEKN